jgi:hypothetical protein
MEALTSTTRAASERQFYALLNKLAEALLQLSDGDVQDAEEIVAASLRNRRLAAQARRLRAPLPGAERRSAA